MDNLIDFNKIEAFDFAINYLKLNKKNHVKEIDSHMHDKCEIYINLTGDISFMVENGIYRVKRGNAIITRPNEYHNCIYNSDAEHEHFWILFSGKGNENLLERFFNRKQGEKNLVCPTEEKAEELIKICYELLKDDKSEIKKYILFFRLIEIISESDTPKNFNACLSGDVEKAIEYINANIKEKLTIDVVAKATAVSVKTLERHFIQNFRMLPKDFIKYKKLTVGTEVLRGGGSVTEAAMAGGFCDTSYFIMIFKKYYKMTPFEYKKIIGNDI